MDREQCGVTSRNRGSPAGRSRNLLHVFMRGKRCENKYFEAREEGKKGADTRKLRLGLTQNPKRTLHNYSPLFASPNSLAEAGGPPVQPSFSCWHSSPSWRQTPAFLWCWAEKLSQDVEGAPHCWDAQIQDKRASRAGEPGSWAQRTPVSSRPAPLRQGADEPN